jgi:hypothetical protein
VNTVTELSLRCVECREECAETWDDHCSACHYTLTGGDLGYAEVDWSKHLRCDGANMMVEFK